MSKAKTSFDRRGKGRRGYTFLVRGSFEFQQTFTSGEVRRLSRLGRNAYLPTKKAMKELEDELEGEFASTRVSRSFTLTTGPRLLIGIAQEDPPGELLYFNPSWGSHSILK